MRNQEVELTIERLVYGGQGLAHWEGQVVFIPFVIPGERVLARLTTQKQKHWIAKLIEVLQPAPERVAPPCPYFMRCGGCHWQHLSYASQLEWKRRVVEEALQRLGKIEAPKVLPTLASPKEWGWRSRILVHGDGQGEVGFYEPNSHRVVDVEQCLISDDSVNQQLQQVRKILAHKKVDQELRSDAGTGFAQVNPGQNEQLKKLLWEWVAPVPHEHVVELFCGNGNFSALFMGHAKTFIGVDFAPEAIAFANTNIAHKHPDTHAQFFCDDAAKWWSRYIPPMPVDLLLLDPPRDGCARMVEGVMKSKPKNIFYISCNPTTLARDLKYLSEFAGYTLVQTQPIDMFPHSFHVESLSWIRKNP